MGAIFVLLLIGLLVLDYRLNKIHKVLVKVLKEVKNGK